jgi:predicted nucleotidyltransferase
LSQFIPFAEIKATNKKTKKTRKDFTIGEIDADCVTFGHYDTE